MFQLVKRVDKQNKKMRTLILICLLSLATVALGYPKDFYTDKYDGIDVDEILGNRRLLIPNIKCVLDQGKCSSGGRELKAHIRDAMETECDKCTEKQKKNTRRVLRHLILNEKDYWEELKVKYDPEGKFSPVYEDAVAKNDAKFFEK